jgi:hypothetical protein
MASGKPTDEASRHYYLAHNPANHRVLRRWEFENYLYDKEILKEYCAREGLSFDEGAYDTLIKNVVDEDVKGKTAQIRNCCGIKVSISNEIFKLKLAECVSPDMNVYSELEHCIFRRG